MIADSYIVPECVVGPGSFGGLMALYESNYIKLGMLIGDACRPDHCCASTARNDCDLYLAVEASARYTQVLRMTYLFEEGDDVVADPDLIIRIYLDARMAEVAGWAAHHRHSVLRGIEDRFGRELDRRWSRNMMLSKWLDYLLESGHKFGAPMPLADAVNGRFARDRAPQFA